MGGWREWPLRHVLCGGVAPGFSAGSAGGRAFLSGTSVGQSFSVSAIFGGTGGHLADTKGNGANQESAGRADSRGGGALFCHGESVQSFHQRGGGMESDGGVGRERYDLTGFGVADFFGGTLDTAERTETAQGHCLFCCECLGDVF